MNIIIYMLQYMVFIWIANYQDEDEMELMEAIYEEINIYVLSSFKTVICTGWKSSFEITIG